MADQIGELVKVPPKTVVAKVIPAQEEIKGLKAKLEADALAHELNELKKEGKIDDASANMLRVSLSPVSENNK